MTATVHQLPPRKPMYATHPDAMGGILLERFDGYSAYFQPGDDAEIFRDRMGALLDDEDSLEFCQAASDYDCVMDAPARS